MSPKLFFTSILILFASLKSCNGETCQPWKDNCSYEKYKCKVDCTENGTPNVCTKSEFNGGDSSTDCPEDTGITAIDSIDKMDGTKCKALCKIAKNCYYYRYEEVPSTNPLEKSCYLMGETQCDDFADSPCDDVAICESGPGSDNQCEGGEDGIVDKPYTCPGMTVHIPDVMPDYKLHWSCLTAGGKDVDIETTKDIPGDTTCTARPECQKDYKYKCVHKVGGGEAEGEWSFIGSGAEPEPSMIGTDKKLKDPFCNAEDLTLKKYGEQKAKGMEILCVETDRNSEDAQGELTIGAQNSCLLMCDGYPILNFHTVAQTWKYKLMEEDADDNLDTTNPDSTIFCHN